MNPIHWLLDLASTVKTQIITTAQKRRWERLRSQGMHIGQGVNLPASTTIDTDHCFLISIGDWCGFGNDCHILAHEGQFDEFLDAGRVARVVIHAHSHIGTRSIILPGVEIGPRTIVGAGSVVTKSLPPDTVCAGSPARVICTLGEYLERHRTRIQNSPTFPTMQYSIRFLTPERQADLVDAVTAHGEAFILGGWSATLRGEGDMATTEITAPDAGVDSTLVPATGAMRNPPAKFPATGEVPVLVLGDGLTVLGVLRTLARRGLKGYHLGGNDPLVRQSRHYRALPNPTGPIGAGASLSDVLRALPMERAVLLPCSDATVRQVASIDPELRSRFTSFVAPLDTLNRFIDKERFASLAREAGVPHPPTWPLTAVDDLDHIPDEAFQRGFLKPVDSQQFFARYGVKGMWVASRAEARNRLASLQSAGMAMQWQVYIPGEPTAHIFLDGFADGASRVRVLLARRRLRMYPADFGNSTAMETIPLDQVRPAIKSLERLLTVSQFRGIFSAEFKLNAEDGQYYVLEVNARPWWYIEFAARAGADVCDWYVRAALGEPDPVAVACTDGARCVYPYYDFFAVRAMRRAGRGTWFAFFRGLMESSQPVWSWSDPLPALSEAFGLGRPITSGAPVDRRREERPATPDISAVADR